MRLGFRRLERQFIFARAPFISRQGLVNSEWLGLGQVPSWLIAGEFRTQAAPRQANLSYLLHRETVKNP